MLFWLSAGACLGLLFAQKSGKELRKELAKSPTPAKTFFSEMMKVDLAIWEYIVERYRKFIEDFSK